MDFLTCYEISGRKVDEEIFKHNGVLDSRRRKLLNYLQEKLRNGCVVLDEENTRIQGQKIHENGIGFSLILRTDHHRFDILFRCQISFSMRIIRITSKPLKDGLIFHATKSTIINGLARYFLYQNSKIISLSMRLQPLTGHMELEFYSHLSQGDLNDIISNPKHAYPLLQAQILNMLKNWNRIMYKFMFQINQLKKDAIYAQNPLMDKNVMKYIKQIEKKIYQLNQYVNQSSLKFPFMFDGDNIGETRFNIIYPNNGNDSQKKMEKFIHAYKMVLNPPDFNNDCKKIINLFSQKKAMNIIPINHDDSKLSSLRDLLRIQGVIDRSDPIYPSLQIYKLSPIQKIASGGFADIILVKAEVKQDPEQHILNTSKTETTIVQKKGGNDGRIFYEKRLINHIKDFKCMFIHKYYKPVLKEEAKNLDLENSILMEFCPQRSLNNYLSACEGIISLPIKLYWLYQVSIALRFLRDLGIVHLDLKPDNILIKIYGKSLPYYLLRLIDFGESYWRATTVHVGAKRGITIPYSAPQLLTNRNKYTEVTDVFSFGVLILNVIFNFSFVELKRLGSKIFKTQSDEYIKFYSMCAEKCKYLGFQPLMRCILHLAFSCLLKEGKRPALDWISIILRTAMLLADEVYR